MFRQLGVIPVKTNRMKGFERDTEKSSAHENLETLSTQALLAGINSEDKKVADAVEIAIPTISAFVDALVPRIKEGGRLFFLGAGTSGRLGIVDASECPPTYGVPHGLVVGIIAGGDTAIRKAVEFAEDDTEQGWKDLMEHHVTKLDTVVGISASGTAPYVIGAISKSKQNGLLTAGISCNPGSPLSSLPHYGIVTATGPEFVTGSTRMKAGTAQKLVLNMISTTLMIKLGRVKGNKMVDMQLSNHKLIARGTRMIMNELNVSEDNARKLLLEHGNVRSAIEAGKPE